MKTLLLLALSAPFSSVSHAQPNPAAGSAAEVLKPAGATEVGALQNGTSTPNSAKGRKPALEDGDDAKAAAKNQNAQKGQKAETGRNSGNKRKQDLASLPLPQGCWQQAQVIAGRPGADSIDLSVLAAKDCEAVLLCNEKRHILKLKAGVPQILHLDGLQADREYVYSLQIETEQSPQYRFHTQRRPGSSFVFALQGDSHPERGQQNDARLYAKTLQRVATERADFYICMGDDFSIDKMRGQADRAAVETVYRAHRPWLSLVNAPLFLLNGNHEQAALCNLDGTDSNVAVWAQNARNKYYPQPANEAIYSGDKKQVEHIGLLRDYYSWQWGDALFVMLDPYWHSSQPVDNKYGSREKNKDPWQATIGNEQYRWLKTTLESSKAKFKFVFTHHLNGSGRGGVEVASLYEWGGQDRKGTPMYATQRPDWPDTLHELMVKNKVSVVFQGHDHIFAKQDLDGVVYQTLPLPAGSDDSLENAQAYRSGKILAGSGYLRVKVSAQSSVIEFMKNSQAEPAWSYEIK